MTPKCPKCKRGVDRYEHRRNHILHDDIYTVFCHGKYYVTHFDMDCPFTLKKRIRLIEIKIRAKVKEGL